MKSSKKTWKIFILLICLFIGITVAFRIPEIIISTGKKKYRHGVLSPVKNQRNKSSKFSYIKESASKAEKEPAALNNIFYFPNRRTSPVPHLITQSHALDGRIAESGENNGPADRRTLRYLKANMKFKGFKKDAGELGARKQGNGDSAPVVIFAGKDTALLRIGSRTYFVRSGEKIKGIFILKAGFSGISYSSNGEIEHSGF